MLIIWGTLEIEKYTQSTMLVLLTLGGTKSKVVRLFNALKKLDEGKVQMSKAKSKKNQLINVPKIDLTKTLNLKTAIIEKECIRSLNIDIFEGP